MRPLSSTLIALRALRRNPLRSALTTLGIIIGVAAVISMAAIGSGARSQIEAQIASLGQNIILVFSGSFTSGGARGGWGSAGTLTVGDTEAILRDIPGVIAVSPEMRTRRQLAAGSQNWNTQLMGEASNYLDIREWPLAAGEMFTEADERGAAKVAVIGQTVADQLFPNEDPVGRVIRVGSVPFTITGLLVPKGLNMMGQDQDDVVILPWTTLMKRIMRTTGIRSIMVQVAPGTMSTARDGIVDLLRDRHRIGGEKEDDFTVRSQEEIAEMATATSRVMGSLLGAIAGVSLVVGGIGIMNIMLVSVTERTREIGIRLAVGAHARDILLQFLIEAVVLSSFGGGVGILVGVGASQIISRTAGWPVLISVPAIVAAVLFSGAIGVFFGFYPARRASRLDPIEALRYE